jgi:hypothetical protein
VFAKQIDAHRKKIFFLKSNIIMSYVFNIKD